MTLAQLISKMVNDSTRSRRRARHLDLAAALACEAQGMPGVARALRARHNPELANVELQEKTA